ncbi:MAG: GNAT family N-acetyltransferase [Planctomycetes bacterium]|nr:GNAT family N-acetyltransferase [Planctomycetota bacterium]
MRYELLEWDSQFFGLPVARILDPAMNTEQLSDILRDLERDQVKLVYWPSWVRHDETAISKAGGYLTDKTLTFTINLKSATLTNDTVPVPVVPYMRSTPSETLRNLAIQSARYSRFAIDPQIPQAMCDSLFSTWITRSIRKEIAREVLVIQDNNTVAGFVTLGEKDGRGDIGLLAVDSKYRRQRFGTALVQAALHWFSTHEYACCQVKTQGRNTAACRVYRKCGYSIEQSQYLYHFWL